jgi:hypothetical protein
VSPGAITVVVVVLAGLVILGVAWDWFETRDRDLDAAARHQSLMRELRRHDGDRRLSGRRPR